MEIKIFGQLNHIFWFFMFPYIILRKTCGPQYGHFFYPWGIIWKFWSRSTRRCYIPNTTALGLVVSEKKSLNFSSFFSLCDLNMQWTLTIWTIIKEGHTRIIPAKFGKISRDVLSSNCWQGTTQWTSNAYNSSLWANGSGELNNETKDTTPVLLRDVGSGFLHITRQLILPRWVIFLGWGSHSLNSLLIGGGQFSLAIWIVNICKGWTTQLSADVYSSKAALFWC